MWKGFRLELQKDTCEHFCKGDSSDKSSALKSETIKMSHHTTVYVKFILNI